MGPKKKRKGCHGWSKTPPPIPAQVMRMMAKSTSYTSNHKNGGDKPISTLKTASVAIAFDSLRSLVMCEGGTHGTQQSYVSLSELVVKQEPLEKIPDPVIEPMLPTGKAIVQNSAGFSDNSTQLYSFSGEAAIISTCRVPETNEVELKVLIKTEPQFSSDEHSPCETINFPHASPYTSSSDTTSSDLASEFRLTGPNELHFNLSGASLSEVLKNTEVNNLILDSGIEEDGTLAFDSLRQLVGSFKAQSDKKSRTKKMPRTMRTCDECGFRSKTFWDLQKHIKYKHGLSSFPCPLKGCTYTTKYPANVKHHLKAVHSQVRLHKCSLCPKSFKRKNQLETHMTTHSDEKPFACTQCEYKTKRNWLLTTHINFKHSDLRPYGCDVCGIRTKNKSDMTKHKRIHTDSKTFLCHDCDKPFAYKARLDAHRRNMHSDKPWLTCPEKNCPQKLKDEDSLQRHINVIHKGIRLFKCDVCSNAYGSKGALVGHMYTHDPTDRPFKCPVCPFLGREYNYVRLHISKVHPHLRPFTCDICHVRFRKQHGLQQHLATEKHKQNSKFLLPPEDNEVKPEVIESLEAH